MMGVNGNDSSAYFLCSSVAAAYIMKRVVTRKTEQGAGPDQSLYVDSVIRLQTLFVFIEQHCSRAEITTVNSNVSYLQETGAERKLGLNSANFFLLRV